MASVEWHAIDAPDLDLVDSKLRLARLFGAENGLPQALSYVITAPHHPKATTPDGVLMHLWAALERAELTDRLLEHARIARALLRRGVTFPTCSLLLTANDLWDFECIGVRSLEAVRSLVLASSSPCVGRYARPRRGIAA